jgi:hypothetical protein
MEQTAGRLTEKIHSLTRAQIAEVERFVESLQAWEQDRDATRTAAALSTPALEAVWSNPEDEVYDAL